MNLYSERSLPAIFLIIYKYNRVKLHTNSRSKSFENQNVDPHILGEII